MVRIESWAYSNLSVKNITAQGTSHQKTFLGQDSMCFGQSGAASPVSPITTPYSLKASGRVDRSCEVPGNGTHGHRIPQKHAAVPAQEPATYAESNCIFC